MRELAARGNSVNRVIFWNRRDAVAPAATLGFLPTACRLPSFIPSSRYMQSGVIHMQLIGTFTGILCEYFRLSSREEREEQKHQQQ